MKKIILLIVSLFLLTSCGINYSVDFQEKYIKESLNLNITEKDYNDYNNSQDEHMKDTLYEYFDNREILSYFDSYSFNHIKTINKTANGINVRYDYDYTYLDYYRSYYFNNCFDNYVVLNEDDYYYIKATGKFNCYYGKTNINIRTDKKVIYSTAQNVSNNNYSWTIDEDNKDNVNILFQMSKTELNDNKINNKIINKKLSTYEKSVFIISFIFLIILLCFIFIRKRRSF